MLRVLIMCASEWAYGAQRRHAAWLRTTVCVALFAFTACSNTATITRRSGPNFEASIEDSDSESVYVRSGNGALYRVPRNDIVDIDHPGNVDLIIGAILVGVTPAVAVDAAGESATNRVGMATAAVLFGLAGIILGIHGGIAWSSSISSASKLDRPARVQFLPLPTAEQPPVPTSVLGSPMQQPASNGGAIPALVPDAFAPAPSAPAERPASPQQ
jgi:hypothetical protein